MKRKKYTYKECIYFSDRTKEVCIDKKDKASYCSRYDNNYCSNEKTPHTCIFLDVLNYFKAEMKKYHGSIWDYFSERKYND